MKAPTIEACRERPPCGGAVLDRAEHKRWHARVFIEADPQMPVVRGPGRPRFIGEPDPEPEAQGGTEGVGGTP